MKKTTHNLYAPVEQQHYKKKYLARKLEEREADKQIDEFTYEQSDEMPYSSSMDEKRPV
jgi:hypothetical protein